MSCRETPGNSAITSFARAACPVDVEDRDCQQAFHALKSQGRLDGAATPTAAEVQEFLRTQEWRVRSNPDLKPAQRDSMLTRLAEARCAVDEDGPPDGATFHAWQNVQAELERRATRRVPATEGVAGNGSAAAASPSTDERLAQAERSVEQVQHALMGERERRLRAEGALQDAQDEVAMFRRRAEDAQSDAEQMQRVLARVRQEHDEEIAALRRQQAEVVNERASWSRERYALQDEASAAQAEARRAQQEVADLRAQIERMQQVGRRPGDPWTGH